MKQALFMIISFMTLPLLGLGQVRNEDILRRAAIIDQQPYVRNMDVARRTELNYYQADTIMVLQEGRFQAVVEPLATYKLPPEVNTAMVKGAEVRQFESKGLYQGKEGMQTLKGRVLDEIYISRIVGTETPASLELFVDTLDMLYYNPEQDAFEGVVSVVLLDDAQGVLSSRELVEPVYIEVNSGSRARVEPKSIRISHTNLPSTFFTVSDKSPQNLVPVNIKTAFNPKGYLKVMKKQPMLRIETPSKTIQGLGVQAIPVRIQVIGNSGTVKVNIVTDKGTVEPDNLEITGDQGATVMLRSEGLGPCTFTISAAGFSEEKRMFNFTFPWKFIIFSFIGGLLGALVIYLMKKGKKNIRKVILLGLITGFIVAVLYYVLGIQLFSFKFNQNVNEFAVLGLGFLGALLWDKIYEMLSKSIAKS